MRRSETFKRRSRALWAIMLRSDSGKETDYAGPLFDSWFSVKVAAPQYLGEPSRVLAFRTRDHARAFCDSKNAECRANHWHFYPVRIDESIKVRKP